MSEQLGTMGIVDKATGPGDLPIEAGNILAKQYNMYVVEAMNQVLQPRIPEIWGGGEQKTEASHLCATLSIYGNDK